MAALVLKRGPLERLRAGHPWIYRGEIADLRGPWSPGEVVDVLDAAGHLVGRGTYNPRTSLACRLLARRGEPVDEALVRRRVAAALEYRRAAGLAADAFRLVWSEADGLPGLVADCYGPVTVVQCATLGMTRLLPWVASALGEARPGSRLYRWDDPTAARIEGFAPGHGWMDSPVAPEVAEARGEAPSDIVVAEGDCRFALSLGEGHKTGLYLDQRENRAAVAAHALGRRVLDAFCYTGAFACHALHAGAAGALLVDSSAEALSGARRNLELNGVADRAELREGNAFDELRQLEARRERFGLIVLDPPPFTRRKDALDAAARGYKEINLRGLRLLSAGGALATFSCSHHVTPALFESICREAAGDAGVTVRVLATLTQARDHPVLLTVPETRYLTGLLLQAV
jgi:23S rRNA (cytosine1962-C5)-methyltransferase